MKAKEKGFFAFFKNVYEEIKYFFTTKIISIYIDTKWTIKNHILFNKVLHDWRPWDYTYQINLFTFGIKQLCKYIEFYGSDGKVFRMKKTSAMKRLIELLETNIDNEVYEKYFVDIKMHFDKNFTQTELAKDEKIKCQKAFEKYHKELVKTKKKHFTEIFRIIAGQDQNELDKLYQKTLEQFNKNTEAENIKKPELFDFSKIYTEWYDGTGIEGWWD